MKRTIWLSYDIGVRGDYEGLYAWLDDHKAKECGDSLALLKYEHSGEIAEALREDLSQAIEITKRTRVYVIYREATEKKMKGTFVFGGRRPPPWSGYGSSKSDDNEDEV